MSADRRRRRPARRRVHRGRLLALGVAAVIVFLLGVAIGQALEDADPSGSSVTYSRTLRLGPPPTTITVTVTSP